MPFFRDEAPALAPELEVECYTLWLDAVDGGYPGPYADFVVGLVQLHELTAGALAWCGDNCDSIDHAPEYGAILRLRADLRLPVRDA